MAEVVNPFTAARGSPRPESPASGLAKLLVGFRRGLRMGVVDPPLAIFHRLLSESPRHLPQMRPLATTAASDVVDAEIAGAARELSHLVARQLKRIESIRKAFLAREERHLVGAAVTDGL